MNSQVDSNSRFHRVNYVIGSILVIIITLVGLESLTRILFDPVDLIALTGRKAGTSPTAEWANIDAFSAFRGIPGQYAKGKTVNSHGFISTPEIEIDKPDSTIRILFLGGSSTAGTGTNLIDEDTWPWQVRQILQDHMPDQNIDFINGALGGYTSFESYGKLWSRLRFFSPDIIVVYHGWNEMYYFNELKLDNIHNWRTNPDGSWNFNVSTAIVYEPLPIDNVIYSSQFLSRMRLLFSTISNGEAGGTAEQNKAELLTDYDHRGLDVWRTNLQLLRDFGQIHGIEVFVAKQATLIVPDLPKDKRSRARVSLHGFDYDAHIDAYNQIYKIIEDEIEDNYIIDVTSLSGVSRYFNDHVHVNREGAIEVANIIAGTLVNAEAFSNIE